MASTLALHCARARRVANTTGHNRRDRARSPDTAAPKRTVLCTLVHGRAGCCAPFRSQPPSPTLLNSLPTDLLFTSPSPLVYLYHPPTHLRPTTPNYDLRPHAHTHPHSLCSPSPSSLSSRPSRPPLALWSLRASRPISRVSRRRPFTHCVPPCLDPQAPLLGLRLSGAE